MSLKEGSVINLLGSGCVQKEETFSVLLRKITVDKQPKKNSDTIMNRSQNDSTEQIGFEAQQNFLGSEAGGSFLNNFDYMIQSHSIKLKRFQRYNEISLICLFYIHLVPPAPPDITIISNFLYFYIYVFHMYSVCNIS